MAELLNEDPAAEFLQQEGDQLRELGIDDAGFSEAAFVQPPTDDFAPAAEDPFAPAVVADEVDPFAPAADDPFAPAGAVDDPFAPATTEEVEPVAEPAEPSVVLANGDFNEFEADPILADAPVPAAVEPLVNGFPDLGGMDAAPVAPVQPIHQITPSEEPESLVKWRDEKAALLQQQEQEEQEAAVAWAEKAKKETEDWYNRYNEQLEKVKNENRAAESQFLEDMTDTKPGNEWEKVARFCDFNPKYSKNTKDVSRMRSLLLQLKQTPLVR